MTFHSAYSGGNCGRGNCSWIAADGEITRDTSTRLKTFIRTVGIEPEGQWLLINSPGGDLVGGLELGKTVRALKMNVRVGATKTFEAEGPGGAPKLYGFEGGVCANACVFAMMGGLERELADEGSKVGVHQFAPELDRATSERATTSTAQTIVAALHEFTIDMGVSANVIAIASATPPGSIKWLAIKILEATNLITSRRAPAEATWSLKPLRAGLAAVATQKQGSGRAVTYVVTCNTFSVYLPLTVTLDRTSEIATAIEGASIRPADDVTARPFPLEIRNRQARAEGIFLSFRVSRGFATTIAKSSRTLELSLDVPHVYWEEIDGPSYVLPRSSLSKLGPHLERSCP